MSQNGNYFIFEKVTKKIWANLQRILELFGPENCQYGLGSRIRDPKSGRNLFRIPDPGVKRRRIPDPDPQH
jgi:hypothetical protein